MDPAPSLADHAIARRFRQIADILEIQGENPFKVRAYRTAADTIDQLEDPLVDIDGRGALGDLSGFGPAIVAKTRDFLATGTTALWERVKDAVPPGVVALAGVPGVGPKAAKLLHESLGVDSIEAADAAAAEGRIQALPGYGAAKEAALRERIAAWKRLSARIPRWRALPLAESLAADLRRRSGDESVAVAGDLRAGRCEVECIEIEASDPGAHADFPSDIDGIPVRVVAAQDAFPGVPWEIRHLPDRVEEVRSGTLRLIEESDFRAQLHEHTTWSDGKASIVEMAEAALSRGYSHLAITDHSRSLVVANGLSRERLLAQLDEIDAARAAFAARGLALLSGLEADILADGSLDMDDDVLDRLDIVVASVHIRHKEDRDAMTARIATALANPRCDILGHPSGRLLGRREAYPVDMDAVIQAAVRHGKALEINASPERMDLDDHWVARGREAGAVFSVNSDAHSTAGLGLLPWGLCMARRGGLAASDAINTWPLERLRAWTAAHRAGGTG